MKISFTLRFALLALLLFLLGKSAQAQTYDLVVDLNGSGAYRSVQAAINAAPTGRTAPFVIFIKNGKYREKITVPSNKPFLQFIGESVANTILSWNDANTPSFPGNSSSFIINASDISALNITFENTYGDAPQGLAMYITGDRVAFKNCRFLGGQDTMQLNSQAGNRSYFKECYIDGVVDFIFGAGRGLFENCIIYPRTRRDGGNGGYITAANTQPGQPYGFVFRNCIIPENRGTTTYTLGRPWQNDLGSTATDRSATKVVWLNTTMGNSIKPVGWQVWDAGTVTSVIQYAEYKSRDFSGNLVNISQRVPWSIQLADADTVNYTRAAVLGNWNPCVVLPNFCGHQDPAIAVSNFWAVKGSATAPSNLTWNSSWLIAGVQYQLFRSSSRRGTYTQLYSTTSAVASNINFGTTDPIPAPGTSYYYYVRASKAGSATHITDTLEISSTPTIFTSGTMQAFLQGGATPSAIQNLQVRAENLTGALMVTPPAGYEVSANGGSTWSGSGAPLTLPQSSTGSVASTTLSVRLNAGPVGPYASNLTLTSAGAATVNIPLTGQKQAAALPQSVVLQWWPMARSNQDSASVRPAALQASTPTLRKLVVSNGSATATIPPYSRTYGQAFAPVADGGWTTGLGGPGGNLSRTHYEQFTVAPSGSAAVRLDSLVFNAYVTGSVSNTKLAVVWSRSGFATDSADVTGGIGPGGLLLSSANGGFTTPILTTNVSSTYRLAFAGATGLTMAAGQRLTFRVYFSCGSSTVTTRFATLKNVQVKGEANVVSSTRRAAAQQLQLYPNPATAECLVLHPVAAREARIAVYSLLGQQVVQVACGNGTQQTAVSLGALAPGYYVVRYTSGAEQFAVPLHKK
ncbi:pectinesterase family protein [Hymenobacter properus]|uniref:T9SS type A sorting domain-containing protein n=1 Tax=Hymenobacter properus TaxID=2791026 RepID=A0A931BIA1_9BACT|nr:pectinesterase family protein [Hymenobacter properus]MBF9144109.1 T9SS type A sorting domain-containing protein [Hymenobacter properus]MBR7722925.1 T9SS type A sorting domain-containing protein [Microvirga sp. SRT04]